MGMHLDIEYDIAKAGTSSFLVDEVNKKIKNGWIPSGDPFTDSKNKFYCPMIKFMDEEQAKMYKGLFDQR